jgi:hypothetical protein
VVEIC